MSASESYAAIFMLEQVTLGVLVIKLWLEFEEFESGDPFSLSGKIAKNPTRLFVSANLAHNGFGMQGWTEGGGNRAACIQNTAGAALGRSRYAGSGRRGGDGPRSGQQRRSSSTS